MFLRTRIKTVTKASSKSDRPMGVLSISGAVHCGANRKLCAEPSLPGVTFFLTAPKKLGLEASPAPALPPSPTNLFALEACHFAVSVR